MNYILKSNSLNICTLFILASILFSFFCFVANLCIIIIIIIITVTWILSGHYDGWWQGMNDGGDVMTLGVSVVGQYPDPDLRSGGRSRLWSSRCGPKLWEPGEPGEPGEPADRWRWTCLGSPPRSFKQRRLPEPCWPVCLSLCLTQMFRRLTLWGSRGRARQFPSLGKQTLADSLTESVRRWSLWFYSV